MRVVTGNLHMSRRSWLNISSRPPRWLAHECGLRRLLGWCRRRARPRANGRRAAAAADALDRCRDDLLAAPDQHRPVPDVRLLQRAERAAIGARPAADAALRQCQPRAGLHGPRAVRSPPGGPPRPATGGPAVRGGVSRTLDAGYRRTGNLYLSLDRRRLPARRRVLAVAPGNRHVAHWRPGR